MNRNEIRATLSERGVKVTGAKISRTAKNLGLSDTTKADYSADEAQAIMELICGNGVETPRQPAPAVDYDAVDQDETAIAVSVQQNLVNNALADVAAIRAAKQQAAELVSDALVAEVESFQPLVYQMTAAKLQGRRSQPQAFSLAAAFTEGLESLGDGLADRAMLPAATGHAR